MYGCLNILYVNGDINIFWRINPNIKQFEMKLLFIRILSITNMIAKIVEINLYVNLLFGLTIGLFFVSAGLFLNINIHPIIPIISFKIEFKCMFKQAIGRPIKIIDDVTRQIQVFVACIPKDGILRMLYISKNIIISLNIPSINEIITIIISFDMVKYIAVSPYSISDNFTSS